jgi:hypothetical protein
MAAPMVPPPPGRFSTTKVWPICRAPWSSTMRATTSFALPAVNGLITWIALVGHGCAPAAEAPVTRTAPAMALHKTRRGVI